MSHQLQTVKFVAVAIAALGFAYMTSVMTQPTPVEGFGLIGEPFFPDLDPAKVEGLRVVTTTEDTASSRVFKIALKDGAYRITSRNDYPADGAEQLGKTANALLGVKREALVSRVIVDHEKYGVVDPLDEEVDATEGRGHRVTLYKEDDVALADFIIGKAVENQNGQHYARLVDKNETFIVTLDFQVSTKFSDWVEDDLLKMDRDDLIALRSLVTRPEKNTVSTEVVAKLDRKTFSDPWELTGTKEGEEVDKDRLTEIVNTLDNLKLIGVRERPEIGGERLLNSDLTISPKFRGQEGLISQIIQSDLVRRGFQIAPTADGLVFLAKSGELVAGTKTGVEYHLSFGNVFSGTEEEMELGGSDKPEEDAKNEKKDDKKDAKEPADGENNKDDEEKGPGTSTTQLRGRYVFARTNFNVDLLGPPPVEPQLPTPPEGVKVDKDGNVIEEAKPTTQPTKDAKPVPKTGDEKATEKKDGGESGCDEVKPDAAATKDAATKDEKPKPNVKKKDAPAKAAPPEKTDAKDDKKTTPADTKTDDKKPAKTDDKAPAKTDDKGDEAKLPTAKPRIDPVVAYKNALAAYRQAKTRYASDLAQYEAKIKSGKERVEELNKRFADWYYVISADDFDKLSMSRDQVVKAQEKPADDPTGNPSNPLGPLGPGAGPVITPKPPTIDPKANPDSNPPKKDDAPKPKESNPKADPKKPDTSKDTGDAKKPEAKPTADSAPKEKPSAPPKPE
jgi:hypothetical protein